LIFLFFLSASRAWRRPESRSNDFQGKIEDLERLQLAGKCRDGAAAAAEEVVLSAPAEAPLA
jgi:hypothetical protein